MQKRIVTITLALVATAVLAQTPSSSTRSGAVDEPNVLIVLRERANTTEWFSATPNPEVYGHQDSLLRVGLAQNVGKFDYMLELGQSAELALPTDAVSPVTAQGQLGLGGTYYAANGNNSYPTAASFRQGFGRYRFNREGSGIRLGRFEFFEGQEFSVKDPEMQWLQTNRIAQRLVGNFGFSNGQRSFDGLDLKFGGETWNFTSMAGRATRGVFNVNANPELNVDIQYLAYTRALAGGHVVLRGFGLGYHDGRTGLTKTDNRSAAVRAFDHKNIRLGTYGGDLLATTPIGRSTLDFLFWGAGQTGQWGLLDHRAGAFALEAGWHLNAVVTKPWLRGGYFRSTGDSNNTDGVHNTFFQVLPTPRIYARFPYFNMMNSKDEFVQLIDKPAAKLELRTDLHFLQLTAPTDFWYQGGGAFDNKVFGYTGRPGAAGGSFSSLYDISADYALTKQVSLSTYYARAFGKTVIASIYTANRNSNYGYFELDYKFRQRL